MVLSSFDYEFTTSRWMFPGEVSVQKIVKLDSRFSEQQKGRSAALVGCPNSYAGATEAPLVSRPHWHSVPLVRKRAYSGSGAGAYGCWPVGVLAGMDGNARVA